MKRRIIPFAVCSLLAAGSSFAREPQAPPSPSATDAAPAVMIGKGPQGRSMFVGHYGEAIEIPYGWTAEAEMRGETEAVYFHPKYQHDFPFRLFQPKKSDYKPENFASMGLIELVVIPKNVPGGLRSLAVIREAKERELKQQGVAYKIFGKVSGEDWPRNTFHVEAETQHRIWQTYSESAEEFYILTFGGGLEIGDYGISEDRILNFNSAKQVVSQSLSDYLRFVHKKSPGEFLFDFREDASDDFFSTFKDYLSTDESPLSPGNLTVAAAMMLLLAFWPGRTARARRARLFGRSLALFSALSGLAGFLAVYVPARIGGASWNSDEVALLIPVLFVPLASWTAARGLGSAHAKRVLVSTGILAALWAAMTLWGADFENLDEPAFLALENTLVLLLIGLTFGVVFALSFGPLPAKEESR